VKKKKEGVTETRQQGDVGSDTGGRGGVKNKYLRAIVTQSEIVATQG
jgi:hypothetical protein